MEALEHENLNFNYSSFFNFLNTCLFLFYKVLCLSSDCLWLRLLHRHRPNARPFTWHLYYTKWIRLKSYNFVIYYFLTIKTPPGLPDVNNILVKDSVILSWKTKEGTNYTNVTPLLQWPTDGRSTCVPTNQINELNITLQTYAPKIKLILLTKKQYIQAWTKDT